MRKLVVFNNISLDGYIMDAQGDMSFAHHSAPDAEWDRFAAGNAGGDGTLVFGRVTYEMMERFWTTPEAAARMPAVAAGMNRMRKIVFSRTLRAASWANASLLSGDPARETLRLKAEPGGALVILGSGTIVSQLARRGLIDEYQVAVIPVALGAGRTMFEGVPERIALKLSKSRAFANGNVLLTYEPR